jgi:hypothetical protein
LKTRIRDELKRASTRARRPNTRTRQGSLLKKAVHSRNGRQFRSLEPRCRLRMSSAGLSDEPRVHGLDHRAVLSSFSPVDVRSSVMPSRATAPAQRTGRVCRSVRIPCQSSLLEKQDDIGARMLHRTGRKKENLEMVRIKTGRKAVNDPCRHRPGRSIPVGRAFQPDAQAQSGWKARPTFLPRESHGLPALTHEFARGLVHQFPPWESR